MGILFDKIVEETRKAKVRGYDWEEYAEGRTIEELVQDNLAQFYIDCLEQDIKDRDGR